MNEMTDNETLIHEMKYGPMMCSDCGKTYTMQNHKCDPSYKELKARREAADKEIADKDKRIAELEKAVGLLNNMVCGGESHSDASRQVVSRAMSHSYPTVEITDPLKSWSPQ